MTKFMCIKLGAAFIQNLCLLPNLPASHTQLVNAGCPLNATYHTVGASQALDLGGKACEGWEPLYRDVYALDPYEWAWGTGEWRKYVGGPKMRRVRFVRGK